MVNKRILPVAAIVILAAACFYVYRDRVFAPPIHITHRSIQPRGAIARRARDWPTDPVVFLFDRELELTSVKVVPLNSVKAGSKHPIPLWELVSDSNSIPVRSLAYGMTVRGMRPAVRKTEVQVLQPGTAYRLYITAGRRKAEHDFTPPLPRS